MRCKDRYLGRVVFGCALLFLCVAFLGSFFPIPANALSEKTDMAELKRKAEAGDAEAQYLLGNKYQKGFGVNKDPVEAVKWWRRAAEQGHGKAQHNMGLAYQIEFGVNKDLAEAVKWFRRAAEQGRAKAQNNMGLAYHKGLGVNKDPEEAVKWFRKAADQGLARAQHNMGAAYQFGSGVNKDPGEEVKWYRKAARQGNKRAQQRLKEMGVPFQEVREGDTKPFKTVVSEPSITIHRVTIKPAKVLAGSKCKMITEYTVHDEKNKGGQVSVKYRYKILKGEKSLFEKKNITLKPCRVDRNCEVSERLNASKKRGTYAIVVTLTYRGHVAKKKVEFRIE